MSRLTTRLYTVFFGKPAGTDSIGNRYYSRGGKRWVIYNESRKGFDKCLAFFLAGDQRAEPSAVPAEWHGWLHHVTDTPPSQFGSAKRPWQKPSQPNKTGTAGAYLPPGHLRKGGHHAPTSAQYEPWIP